MPPTVMMPPLVTLAADFRDCVRRRLIMRDDETRDRSPPAKPGQTKSQKPPLDDGHEDEEKLLAGQNDVNMPALLTRDVPGG